MAVCFQLFPIGSDVPANLSEVDARMCEHFGQTCYEDRYLEAWDDIVGYLLATGRTFAEAKARLAECAIPDSGPVSYSAICDWLEANYTTSSFY